MVGGGEKRGEAGEARVSCRRQRRRDLFVSCGARASQYSSPAALLSRTRRHSRQPAAALPPLLSPPRFSPSAASTTPKRLPIAVTYCGARIAGEESGEKEGGVLISGAVRPVVQRRRAVREAAAEWSCAADLQPSFIVKFSSRYVYAVVRCVIGNFFHENWVLVLRLRIPIQSLGKTVCASTRARHPFYVPCDSISFRKKPVRKCSRLEVNRWI